MQKSDNLVKNIKLKIVQIGISARLGIHTKKAPQQVHSKKWCAILCDYRTNDYEEFKEISRKIFFT